MSFKLLNIHKLYFCINVLLIESELQYVFNKKSDVVLDDPVFF